MAHYIAFHSLLAVVCVILLSGCIAPTFSTGPGCEKTRQKPEDLAGVWIGFDSDGLEFMRVELRADFTGYCARVSADEGVMREYGVEAYRITHWTVDDSKLTISLAPATTNAEPIYLRGKCFSPALDLEVGGTNEQWKRKLVLYRELRIDGANRETRDKIKELENQ